MAARLSSPVLVGREDHLRELTDAIAASSAGAPRFIVVRGEAGIGKSRLVRETLDRLPPETAVLFGECLDIGGAGLPYLPLVEALRRLARATDPALLETLLGAGRADLALLVPDLALPAGPESPAASPTLAMSGLAQARLFERVLALLRALAARAPTVLVIEDVHWIDRATRDLLTFLARNLTDEALAVVMTVRTDDLPRGHPILAWLADLERSPATVVVEPPRLGRRAVERLLRVIEGGALEPGLAEQIWRRSDGNPLFVEELCAVSGAGGSAPRSVVEVLLARVARLDPGARAVVDAAAVAARPVDERLLAGVLELPDGEVDDRIRQAHELGVLEIDPTTDRHRFRHELLREVVERELLPGARRRLHERFARLLEAQPELAEPSAAGAAGELALHYAEAGLADEAYAWSIAAAEAAEAVHAYADAHRHFERALDLERHRGVGATDAAGQVDLRTRAADAADLAGDPARSLELTRDALARLDPVIDPVAAGLLHSRIGYLQWSLGDGPAALASHEEAVRLVPATPPTAVRARVLGSLGGALMGEGRWAESRALCEAAIECAVEAAAPAEESRARNMLGSDLVALGEVDAGLDELRAACRIAAAAGRADMRIVGHHNLALNLLAADHLEDAVAEARTGIEIARDAGLERRFGQDLAAIVADALTRLGRLDEADRAAAEGLALDPNGHGTVYLSTVVARLAALRGDTAAHDHRRGELDLAALDPDVAAFVAAVAAEAWLWADRPDDAIAETEAGLGRLEGLDDVLWSAPLVALGLRGLADGAEAGRPARASPARAVDPRLDAFGGRLEALAPRVSTTSGGGWVALGRGEIARASGEEGDAAWRAAIAAFDAVPAPLEAAYARLRAAEGALRARGLRADVTALLGEAADAAGSAGARPLAEAIAALAARARIPTSRPAPVVVAPADEEPEAARLAAGDPRAAAAALGLSAREIEVLELVTAGYTNGEIAERLFITRKTAAVHVTHILDKLGVANRVGAAMIGARVGLGADRDDYSE